MNTNMGILGRKIGMTQVYDESGNSVPVTAIDAGPCRVIQVKSPESDGYSAIQLGMDEKPPRNVPDEIVKKANRRFYMNPARAMNTLVRMPHKKQIITFVSMFLQRALGLAKVDK